MREFGKEVLGTRSKQTVFPLLVKFLDAHDRLSLQVHPNDAQARELAGVDRGKTEAWVILDAAPGSQIYAGLKPGIGRKELEAAITSGSLPDCVHTFQARVGDCFLIPTGTIHAIGEGVLLAEIQQTCDVTFRLHDWGRLGTDGRPRQLHLEQALQCLDFGQGQVDPLTPRLLTGISDNRVEELVCAEHFVIRRHIGSQAWARPDNDEFRILMLLEGQATVQWLEGTESLQVGDTILIPAACPQTRVIPQGHCTLLETYLPV
jgi:mannose-6-phosphate isomerase